MDTVPLKKIGNNLLYNDEQKFARRTFYGESLSMFLWGFYAPGQPHEMFFGIEI